MKKFKHYLETSNLLYLIKIDLNANYVYANNFFINSFDLKIDEIIGSNALETIITEDHEICIATVEKCIANPSTPIKVSLRKPYKDSFKHTEWEFSLIKNEDDILGEIVCIGYDNSDFINNNQKLTLSEIEVKNLNSKFEALFNTKSLGLVLHDIKGNILVANQSFYQMIDFENYAHKSNNILDFVPPKLWDGIKDTLELIKKTKESSFRELEFIHANGSIINVNVNKLIFEDNNGEPLIWSVIRDITERKNNLKLLENQKDLLKQTTDIAELGGWEIDLKNNDTIWTDKIYDIHDIDMNFKHNLDNGLSFYHPDDQPYILEAINTAATIGTSFDIEARFVSFKKNKKWIRIKGEGVVENGKIETVKGIIQDITKRKSNEETIFKQQSLLKEIYFMQSHTIRLPLANVIGLVDLLKYTLPHLSEENQEVFEKLKYSANQLDDVIKRVAENQPDL